MCCSIFNQLLNYKCDQHDKYECGDNLFDQHQDGSVGIIIHTGGSSMIVIGFCPFCGTKLKTDKEVGSRYIDVVGMV